MLLSETAPTLTVCGGTLLHADAGHIRDALLDGSRIGEDQTGAGLGGGLRPVAGEVGGDEDQVRAQAGDLAGNGGSRAVADGDHDDDRRHADDDAQHGQQRTDLVLANGFHGNA